ncbi:putative gamma-tubulin complex component protein [Dioscorea sansibarensis]
MEVDPNLSLLRRNLKVDDPWISPKTWESISSESGGGVAPSSKPRQRKDHIYDTPVVSESALVRLAINALLGVKSALVEIDKLSTEFSVSLADRTSHRIPDFWRRWSSASALAKLLNSFFHSGLVFFLVRRFVDYNLSESHNAAKSLVNQGFAVAVGKVLEGYACALNTLLASVKLRRSSSGGTGEENSLDGVGSLTSVVHSDVTVLEVFLHTKELRTRIEALGNICFADVVNSSREDLSVDIEIEFGKFPRGADLLSYLYVQLRDADPVHYALLKFLFICASDPYCGFIKSWIYRASIADPYKEFHVVRSDGATSSKTRTGPLDDLSLAYVKELDFVSVPCFLEDASRPLIRAGQQLQVLVKLLKLCDYGMSGYNNYERENDPKDLPNLGDVLPFWEGVSSDSAFLLNPIMFCRKDLGDLVEKRNTMYQMMLDKLDHFFTKLDVKYHQLGYTGIPSPSMSSSDCKRNGVDISLSLPLDLDLIWTPTIHEQGASVAEAQKDNDDSSTSDDLCYVVDSSQLSDSSSFDSCEEGDAPSVLGVLSQPDDDLLSRVSIRYDGRNALQKLCETVRPNSLHPSSHNSIEGLVHVSPLVHPNHEDMELSKISTVQQFGDSKCSKILKTINEGFQSGECWPLGGLLENPFYANMKYKSPKQLHFTEFVSQTADENSDTIESEKSYFHEVFVSESSGLDPFRRIKLMNDTFGARSMGVPEPWASHDLYDLSTNPILRKSSFLHSTWNLRDRSSSSKTGLFFSYFDFSSVSDPCKVYSEYEFQVEAPIPTDSSVPSSETENVFPEQCVSNDMIDKSTMKTVISSSEDFQKEPLQNASSGANWEGSLSYSGEDSTVRTRDKRGLFAAFETPLDVVISKCVVQGIMLQYNYVSNFTIKLLEQGFDLHGHLLALRRYHFMELADWADSFILSLRNQKWYGIEPELKMTEIQGQLDLALRRSSCENDRYRERLFLSMKGQNITARPHSTTGIHWFDFLVLGYRVDWPVSVVITPEALERYAAIFNHLIQIRLAAFSLADVWCCLKTLMYPARHNRNLMHGEMKNFNILIKMREQINHFVSTLQHYVHSQLSHVSWSHFQYSLKHKVKDLFDLESVHMTYLADALHICFLSDSTEPVAIIIKNILYCALNFRQCFFGGGLHVASHADSSSLLSRINFTQVLAVKAAFEKNIKDLYLLYLKLPKHGECSICRFWDLLNYNNFYSTTFNQGTKYFSL